MFHLSFVIYHFTFVTFFTVSFHPEKLKLSPFYRNLTNKRTNERMNERTNKRTDKQGIDSKSLDFSDLLYVVEDVDDVTRSSRRLFDLRSQIRATHRH